MKVKNCRAGVSLAQLQRRVFVWPMRSPGVWSVWPGISPLPKGDLRIARQFTAGFRFDIPQVPKGRLKPSNVVRLSIFPVLWQRFSRPFGTRCPCSTIPPLKGWAILGSPSGRQQTNSHCWSGHGGPKCLYSRGCCAPKSGEKPCRTRGSRSPWAASFFLKKLFCEY